MVIKGQFPSAWGLFEGVIGQKGFLRGMFISTGGVYQRRSHLREVLKGGIYISFIREIMVEVY